MERRELLKMIAILTGGAVIAGDFILEGCKNPLAGPGLTFSEKDISLLDEVAETILPATKSPGAKATKVGQFMTVIVNDCYDEKDQQTFHDGISKLNEASKKMFEEKFIKLSQDKRHDLLLSLDKEAKEYQNKKNNSDKEKAPDHYFTMIKQLTLWGFFTSEIGIKQALSYVPVPGRFDACIDYKKGDKIMVGLMG